VAEQGEVTSEIGTPATATAERAASTKQVRQLDRVVIRFAGDSGDGMQLTGDRFTSETAQLGNDISTLPNFPAEIRACPASRCTSPTTTSSPRATPPTCWWR
jgi:2-oxoglutarate ferredoxin oxidoreductase subunit alpha